MDVIWPASSLVKSASVCAEETDVSAHKATTPKYAGGRQATTLIAVLPNWRMTDLVGLPGPRQKRNAAAPGLSAFSFSCQNYCLVLSSTFSAPLAVSFAALWVTFLVVFFTAWPVFFATFP